MSFFVFILYLTHTRTTTSIIGTKFVQLAAFPYFCICIPPNGSTVGKEHNKHTVS
ncbi:hypothetical protein EVA_20391 [gut metagenome]|uniref:Uncharacterized protein n=1 Tax=gut metagenome TaxID=749906 RepID=J9FPI8_9ZZZZ